MRNSSRSQSIANDVFLLATMSMALLSVACDGFLISPPSSSRPAAARAAASSYHIPFPTVLSRNNDMASSLFESKGTGVSFSSVESNNNDNGDESSNSIDPSSDRNNNDARGRLRKITGFSLTALRATMRATTGISLKGIYVSTFVTTSAAVRKAMTLVLAPFPTWLRCFAQPFLVMYYTPLFILRNLSGGPTRKNAIEAHEGFLETHEQKIQEQNEQELLILSDTQN